MPKRKGGNHGKPNNGGKASNGGKTSKKGFKPGFRAGKKANSNHPAFTYAQDGEDFKYVSITHKPVTQNIDNVPLVGNPDPTDNRPAYALPIAKRDKRNKFGEKYHGWRFADEDIPTVNDIIKKGGDKPPLKPKPPKGHKK
jgi:hypothetical protein